MKEGGPVGFGPRGRYRFPAAINVVFNRKGDRLELAIALDDGGRATRLEYRTWPSGKPGDAQLAEVAFPGGGVGRATQLTVPAASLGVKLDLLDASGKRIPDISCLFDTRTGTLIEPPFSGEGYELAGPVESGPAGAFSRPHVWTLVSAKGEGADIRGRFLLDDGGQAFFVETTDPRSGRSERRLFARATASAPAALELTFLAEPMAGYVDLLDRKGQVLRELSLVFDFKAGELRPQTPDVCSGLYKASLGREPHVVSTTCRVCRGLKPVADCVETNALAAGEREVIHRESLPSCDLPFVCTACSTRILEAEKERRRLSRLQVYWVTLASSLTLFLQAFFGVMQLLLPHGPWVYTFLERVFPFLAAKPAALLALAGCLWGFLFTLLPLAGMFRAYFAIFFVGPMGSGALIVMSLGVQLFLGYWVVQYLHLARVPEFVPHGAHANPLLWLNFYLYAVLAALANVVLNELFGQSLGLLAERMVRKGPGIASRVNRIFRRFQKLAGLHEEAEIWRTLKELLQEDMAVAEYHVLLADEHRHAFTPRVSEGRALAEIASVKIARGDANFLGHAAMFGEVYGRHSLKNPDLKRVLHRGPLECEVCLPVKVEGEVRALLNIGRFAGGEFDSDDLAHLSTLASLLGLALTNASEHRRKDEQLAESQEILLREQRKKEEMRSAFEKYVPPALIDRIMQDPDALEAEPERGALTVLFTDLKGFSTLSEKVGDPTELARLLNMYLTAMTNIVFKYWGTLDKYVGDAVVAFFGWPLNYYEDHARRAVLAAIEMRDRMHDLAGEMGHPELAMRIGVNTGEMVVGNFGSAIRKSLTVLGDNVNLGARLEPTNKEYHTDVLITGETYKAAADHVWARQIDLVRVVGRKTPVVLYEPIAPRTLELPEELVQLIALYTKGLTAYRARNFGAAIESFRRALELVPEDGPSSVMMERAVQYKHSPPPPDWDGVYSVKVK